MRVRGSTTATNVAVLIKLSILRESGRSKGYRTLRPQDTSAPKHFGPASDTSVPSQLSRHFCVLQKRGTRHFDIRSTKSGKNLDPGQFRQDTAPPVIRLKAGAEVSWCRNVVWPKCPAPEPWLKTRVNPWFGSVVRGYRG